MTDILDSLPVFVPHSYLQMEHGSRPSMDGVS